MGIELLMDPPIWMLMPWAVVALAAGFRFWGLISLFRKQLLGTPSQAERVRQALERIWQRDQTTALMDQLNWGYHQLGLFALTREWCIKCAA